MSNPSTVLRSGFGCERRVSFFSVKVNKTGISYKESELC